MAGVGRVVGDGILGLARAMQGGPAPLGAASAAAREADDCYVYRHITCGHILEQKHTKWEKGIALFVFDDADLASAVRKMVRSNVGALLVMNRKALDSNADGVIQPEEVKNSPSTNAILGIVTERDVLRSALREKPLGTTTVREVMTRKPPLFTVTTQTPVLKAMDLMTQQKIRHTPVLSPCLDKMEGVISLGDAVKAVVEEEREEIRELTDYIFNSH